MKKGFTLIELLAVIVILSIIAAITIPMIMGVIDKAKIGALEDSAYGLVESANLYYSKNVQAITDKVIFNFTDGNQTENAKLDYKGKVDNGKLILNTDGKIVVCIDNGTNYAYKELKENKVVTGNGICSYDGNTGDFNIISNIDILNKEIEELNEKVNNLENEISSAKSSLSEAITNKGIETSSNDSFETMVNNVNNIKSGSTVVALPSGTTNIKQYIIDNNLDVDYTTLTSDNFYIRPANLNYTYVYSDGNISNGSAYAGRKGISLSYNASTGVLSQNFSTQVYATAYGKTLDIRVVLEGTIYMIYK